MKKALLLLSVVGLLSVAQAITIQWTVPADFAKDGISFQLVNVGTGATFSEESLLAVLSGGTLSTGYTSVKLKPGAFFSKDEPLWVGEVTADKWTGSGTYYLLLFNTETDSYAYNKTGVSVENEKAFGDYVANKPPVEGKTYDPGEYTTGVLPEPTALALLALGVAGLALRRKIA